MGRKPTKETTITIKVRVAHDDELDPVAIVERVLDDGPFQEAINERIDDDNGYGVVMSVASISADTAKLTKFDLEAMGFDPTPEPDAHDADMAREAARRRLMAELEANYGGVPMWNNPALTYNGWRFSTAWSMSGTWGFSHPDSPVVVYCTPDWEKEGHLPISCETSDGTGVPDDMAGVEVCVDVMTITADGFFALVQPWLDKHQPAEMVSFPRMLTQNELLSAQGAAPTSKTVERELTDNRPEMPDGGDYKGDDIYLDVNSTLQNAEECGGPEGMRYIELMHRIAKECMRRAHDYHSQFKGGPR